MPDQFVSLPYELVNGKVWSALSYSSQSLYTKMRAALYKRSKTGIVRNCLPDRVRFGNSDIPQMSSATYTKCVSELRIAGLIQMLEPGGFPRRKGLFLFIEKWRAYEEVRG
jgi:hypothetical protein